MKQLLTSHDVVSILCQIDNRFNIYGSQSPDNLAVLVDIAKQLPPDAVCVELGTRVGYSALALLLGNLDLKITTVDKNPGTRVILDTAKHLQDLKWLGHLYIPQEWGLEKRINFVSGDSAEEGRKWNKKIDYLFIDAEHDYESVKKDVEAWLPHLKLGSLVGFHDWAHPKNKGMAVTEVVNDMILRDCIKWKTYKANYQMIFFQKRRED